MKIVPEIKFTKVTEQQQDEAKALILEGFKERFGFIDPTLNPDLSNIYKHFNLEGNAFFVGFQMGQIICTGAIANETNNTARIERMSVKKDFRRQGIARAMLYHLEDYAKDIGYSKAILETNIKWPSAINLYQNNGYDEYTRDEQRVHMVKYL
ncbi:GNAT family N-acetyltransferase [Virgibacillus kekensis]|uniref:GNAT family N-acetyltransferase n=1 Tax=Virgibacillus kekensis TaxID=202261 RepID=A0ABV9DL14_9BACI